jgi:hypothetical protein
MPNIIPHGLGSPGKSDGDLLTLHERYKKEAFAMRWVFERQWIRNLYYILGRQWIYYDTRRGEWRDKRLAKWIPRPVTNVCKTTESAIAAMFATIKLGANARPTGDDPLNIIAAAAADNYAPILHEEHEMDEVMSDFDFWLITCGNSFLHTYLDSDQRFGVVQAPVEHCPQCGKVGTIADFPDQMCPECQQPTQPVVDPVTNTPKIQRLPEQRGQTCALSPFELAFSLHYNRWNELPFVYRLRWRDKYWYENHSDEAVRALVPKISWQKSPAERTMQIYKSLPLQNDLGVSNSYSMGATNTDTDGVSEFDLYIKPCEDFPDGYVCRFVGDADPLVLHTDSESLPGPLPYHDAEGNPLWTFTHGTYSKIGGRILGSGALDCIINKQNDLNQLDSMMQMIVMRMANPIWLEPKGAEVEKFTGEPGLVVKYNPLTVQGGAKPERIPGEGPNQSLFMIRQQLLADIEDLTGTFDVLKGAKPSGVEAFSALQLLVERGQSRFANTFMSRGNAYKDWFKFALEIEREHGPDERTKSVLGPNRGWMFETLKKTQLEGNVNIVVEDGTTAPKTQLGRRAAMEHASQLGILNVQDPDSQYAMLDMMGLTNLVPTLDAQVQAALRNQEGFERWVGDQQARLMAQQTGTSPLAWRRWFDPMVHRAQFVKWANSDRVQRMLAKEPALSGLLDSYLIEMDLAISMKASGVLDVGPEMLQLPGPVGAPDAPQGPGGPKGQVPGQPPPGQPRTGAGGSTPGQGQAMGNSNRNSAPAGNTGQPEPGQPMAA